MTISAIDNSRRLPWVLMLLLCGGSTMAFAIHFKKTKQTKASLMSSETTNEESKKPKLFGFMPLEKDPDSSPACIKLSTYFRMVGLDYEYVPFEKHWMKDAPKGKCPFVQGSSLFQDYKPMGDSTLIIQKLVQQDPKTFDLDRSLSKTDRAISVAFQIMLEESLYWATIEARWRDTVGFETVTIPTYFGNVPWFLRGLITKQSRGKVLRDYRGQGTGLHSPDEVVEKLSREILAVSTFLADKPYMMGNQPTLLDASAYGFIAPMMQGKWEHPVFQVARNCENLVQYVERMRKEFWPELQKA